MAEGRDGGSGEGAGTPRVRHRRDRRGRGPRGPGVFPRTLGEPFLRTRRERFDDLALTIVAEVDDRWQDDLGLVEYAVEDAPQLDDDWDGPVPLASLVRGQGGEPTRLVLFRRPIERRAPARAELEVLLLTVVVEKVAELLGLPPEDVDPRYEA